MLLPVDMNTATAAQLCTLPNIGNGRAKQILQLRSSIAPRRLTFRDVLTIIPKHVLMPLANAELLIWDASSPPSSVGEEEEQHQAVRPREVVPQQPEIDMITMIREELRQSCRQFTQSVNNLEQTKNGGDAQQHQR
jgi:hypothetical protein